MVERINNQGYIDIEHLMYHHLNPNLISIIQKIGIQGNIAPNGHGVKE